jgi:hypothetical protein
MSRACFFHRWSYRGSLFLKLLSYGVLMTPALVVEGVVKIAGKLPKLEEIKEWIR